MLPYNWTLPLAQVQDLQRTLRVAGICNCTFAEGQSYGDLPKVESGGMILEDAFTFLTNLNVHFQLQWRKELGQRTKDQ